MLGTSTADSFDAFWQVYPKRVAKKDARKAWAQLKPSAELTARILTAVETQRQDRARAHACGQWVPEWPYPASWIRGERWDDERLPIVSPQRRQSLATNADVDQMRKTQEVKRLMREEGLTLAAASHRVGYR